MSHFTDSNNLPSAGGNRPEHHIHDSSDPIPGNRGVNAVDYSAGAINANAPSQTWGDSPAGGRGPGGDFPSGIQTNTDFGEHGHSGAAGGSSGLAGVGSGTGFGHSGEHEHGGRHGLGDINSSSTGAHNSGHHVAPGVPPSHGITGLGDAGTGPTGGHSSFGGHDSSHSTGQHGLGGDHNTSHSHHSQSNVPGGHNAFHEERPLDVKPTHDGGVAVGGRSDLPEGKASAFDKLAGKTEKVIGKLTGNAEKHERGELREAGGKAAVAGEARVPHD